MTFYLKYRPQTISELDLDAVRTSLANIIKSQNIPHAFLFSGPRGAGKTSTARILAKVLNCEKPKKDGEPCNECSQCLSITRGNSLDVIEIDAASNRGVDDIRSLRETVKLSPAGSKKKVYIIDEAHMLTTEAANALLKTLEEPPAHAVFILATTEAHKLLDTIRSRCTNVNFYKGGKDEVLGSLQKIVDGEKLKIDKKALDIIAEGVDGSFREAHKVLEQLSFLGKKIEEEDVKNIFSGANVTPEKFLELLKGKDTKGALEEIERVGNLGVNLRVFTGEAVGVLRKELIESITGTTSTTSIDVQRLIELLSEAYRQFPTAVIAQLPLEMVVWKWGVGGVDEQSQFSRSRLNSPSEDGTSSASSRSRGSADSGHSTLGSTLQNLAQTKDDIVPEQLPAHLYGKVEEGEEKREEEEEIELSSKTSAVEATAPLITSPVSEVELETTWREIMRQTKEKNTSVEALLRACRPESFDGKTLKVEVFYKFHKEKLEQTLYRDLIERIASGILGVASLRMLCILSNTKKRAADVNNVVPTATDDISQLAEQIFTAGDGKVH